MKNCSTGYLCAYLAQAPNNGWYVFKFYTCQRYYLNDFVDEIGDVVDDQTGGVTTTYYGASGNVLQTMKPAPGQWQFVMNQRGGWDPVYSIEVC